MQCVTAAQHQPHPNHSRAPANALRQGLPPTIVVQTGPRAPVVRRAHAASLDASWVPPGLRPSYESDPSVRADPPHAVQVTDVAAGRLWYARARRAVWRDSRPVGVTAGRRGGARPLLPQIEPARGVDGVGGALRWATGALTGGRAGAQRHQARGGSGRFTGRRRRWRPAWVLHPRGTQRARSPRPPPPGPDRKIGRSVNLIDTGNR